MMLFTILIGHRPTSASLSDEVDGESDDTTTVAELRKLVADFVAERDWSQFHSPKNVSMALAIEAAELMEHFQWLTTDASRELAADPEKLAEVGEELADVIGYSFAFANELGLDISSAVRAKMVKNTQKYPAEKYRGRYERPKNSCVKPPLAIVGASTRSAAASAVRAGFQPFAADLFGDADLQRIATTTRIRPYPEGFLDWMRTVEPPGWMYTGALENYPELVDQMAWIAPLLGNPGDVLARIRSPWELAAALRTAGLLFPETRDSAEGLPTDGSWLAKTYNGASGSGVRVFGGSGSEEYTPNRFAIRSESTACRALRCMLPPKERLNFSVSRDRSSANRGCGLTVSIRGINRSLAGFGWNPCDSCSAGQCFERAVRTGRFVRRRFHAEWRASLDGGG